MLNRIIVVLAAMGLAACSYPVASDPPQAPQPFMAYTNRVPGKWLLLVDATAATARPGSAEVRCGQFDYPMNFTRQIAETAAATFEKVADDVRLTDHRLSRAEYLSGGYSGEIILRVTSFRPHVAVDGVLDATANADMQIEGTIIVTKTGQRMVDGSESGNGHGTRDAGLACAGAADALSDATNLAMQDLVRKLAEAFANSHMIRYSVPGLAPQ